jgi:hypothetical protein
MRGLVHSLSPLSSILLVSLLVLSTHVLWAQKTSNPEEGVVSLPDAPSPVATVSEAQTHLSLTYFKQNRGQTESWMRSFPDHTGYDRLSINTSAALNHYTGTAEFWSKNKYSIGSAPPKWKWAASAILRMGQQAKAHPHITTILKSVHPRF